MSMLITTTPTLQGRAVRRHLGLVCGEATLVLRRRQRRCAEPEAIGTPDWPGERAVQCAREAVIAAMTAEAEQLGANPIVAVDLDFERLGGRRLLVCASGTAVICAEEAAVAVETVGQPGALGRWQAARSPLPVVPLRRARQPAAERSPRCSRRPPSPGR